MPNWHATNWDLNTLHRNPIPNYVIVKFPLISSNSTHQLYTIKTLYTDMSTPDTVYSMSQQLGIKRGRKARQGKQVNYTQDSSFFAKKRRRASLGGILTHDTLQPRRALYQHAHPPINTCVLIAKFLQKEKQGEFSIEPRYKWNHPTKCVHYGTVTVTNETTQPNVYTTGQ